MNFRTPTRHLHALVVLFAVLFLAVIPACTTPGGASPSRAWVDASRAFHGVIGARFQAYVRADPTLDPTTRETLARTVDDWDFMIRAAEAALEPAPPAAAPAAAGVHQ